MLLWIQTTCRRWWMKTGWRFWWMKTGWHQSVCGGGGLKFLSWGLKQLLMFLMKKWRVWWLEAAQLWFFLRQIWTKGVLNESIIVSSLYFIVFMSAKRCAGNILTDVGNQRCMSVVTPWLLKFVRIHVFLHKYLQSVCKHISLYLKANFYGWV